MLTPLRIVLVYGALALASVPAAGMTAADVESAIATATTRADHEAIAVAYEEEARALDEKAERHTRMESTYRKHTHKSRVGGSRHCKSLAARYRAAAKENRTLAKMHRDAAEHGTE